MKKSFFLIFLSLLFPFFIFSSAPKNPGNRLAKNSRLKNPKGKRRKQLIPLNRVKLSTKNNTKENPNKIKMVASTIKKPETKNYQSGTKQINDLTDKIKFLDAQIITLKSDLTQKEQELKTAQSDKGNQTQLQVGLDEAKKELELKEKELLAQKEAFDKKELSEQGLQTELKTKTEELENLLKSSNVSDDLKKENEKLVKKNSELEGKIKEIEQLKVKIESLQIEKENVKTLVDEEIKKEKKSAQEIIVAATKKMEEEIAKKDKELKEAKEKLRAEYKKTYEENYKNQIIELEKTIEKLNGQLSEKNNTAQKKFEENTKANKARIEELNKKVELLEKENKELKAKIKELENNQTKSQEVESALTKEKELLESKITELNKQIETLKSSNGTADQKIINLNKELETKNKELALQNKKLQEDIASKEKQLQVLTEKDKESSLWTAMKINNLRVAIENKDSNQDTFKEYQVNKKQIENAIKALANKIHHLSAE